jgi:hypothetical protein
MTKRFFKLLYVLALIALGLSLPIYLLTNIQFDTIVRTTYKAQCISNNQYVVLEGSQIGEAYQFDEFTLNDTIYNDTKKTLNFYCKYYDAIQPYIVAYTESKTNADIVKANTNFFNFQESVFSNVYSYPPLYKLEVVSNITQLNEIYNPIIKWFIIAVISFIGLQVVRMCYVYIVFGKVMWHPFGKIEIK